MQEHTAALGEERARRAAAEAEARVLERQAEELARLCGQERARAEAATARAAALEAIVRAASSLCGLGGLPPLCVCGGAAVERRVIVAWARLGTTRKCEIDRRGDSSGGTHKCESRCICGRVDWG